MPTAVCLGEILIDFVSTRTGVTVAEAPGFEKKPGGAPANVACGLARLGVDAAFIGKVGQDAFGRFLRGVLRQNRVDAAGLVETDRAHTTLAFVSLAEGGERSFEFYRDPGADTTLDPSEVDLDAVRGARVFHFGSISLTDEPAGSATRAAIDAAESAGVLRSYDPNLREALWPDLRTARRRILSVLPKADVLKVSEEEAVFLTGQDDPVAGARELAEQGPSVVWLTRGRKGCVVVRDLDEPVRVPGFRVRSVDTTGAGDAFAAAALAGLLDLGATPDTLSSMEIDDLVAVARFANAAGALSTLKRGAIPSLPDRRSVETALQGVS